MLASCHSTDGGGGGGSGPVASAASGVGSAAVVPTPTASPSAPGDAPSPGPAPSGDARTVRLASGATLLMPEQATLREMKNAAQRLPGVVKAAHKYELGSEKRLVLVNEMDREGQSCEAILDRELERANKAKNETDQEKRAMRQMQGVTELQIAGHRALYAVSANRAPSPGGEAPDASRPMMGVSTLILCRGDDYVVIMHATDQAETPEETKQTLVDIAKSFKPAG